jgi:tetratricopeptide (TPR) repeat protein
VSTTLDELQRAAAGRRPHLASDSRRAHEFVLCCLPLAAALREAGRPDEALELLQEGIATCRRWRRRYRKVFRDCLADCVWAYAGHLRAQGNIVAALEAMQEAVTLRRGARAVKYRDPARAQELGMCLWDLMDDQSAAGRHTEALHTAREALTVWRWVAAAGPVYEAAVGISYDKLSVALGELRRWPEAVKMSRKAVAIFASDETGFDLAASLAHLAIALAAIGDDDESREVSARAAAIEARLACGEPPSRR